jgi:hypothetical protein
MLIKIFDAENESELNTAHMSIRKKLRTTETYQESEKVESAQPNII